MIFHENRLPADISHEISCLICYFRKGDKILYYYLTLGPLAVLIKSLYLKTVSICTLQF